MGHFITVTFTLLLAPLPYSSTYWAQNYFFPWVAWNWVKKIAFTCLLWVNKPQINYPISRNPWEVIILGPVQYKADRSKLSTLKWTTDEYRLHRYPLQKMIRCGDGIKGTFDELTEPKEVKNTPRRGLQRQSQTFIAFDERRSKSCELPMIFNRGWKKECHKMGLWGQVNTGNL